ncbi:MAG: TonB-dependent receptor [Bacteroidia bacterium]|nr:TonB-dependent receptor [Bacteroidia bacterium]MCX7652998.1 TonB-dependent receptor [Bacteroidia bacterium]MDW8416136.1 TonB-dependent receptor [Bacteroidia bacterium]
MRLIAVLGVIWAQGTIRGSVVNNEGEPVVGAQVVIFPLQKGTLTNAEGLFSIAGIPHGKYRLRVSAIGIDTLWQEVEVTARRPVITVKLEPKVSAISLEAVEIVENVAPARIDPTRVTVAVTPISPKQIFQLPSFGVPDIAQYLQVLPGVVFTGDQGGQLYIRGGTPIQNLTLLDGAIVYSPFHTLSLFSIFETDILRQVNVYSAGFGAEYGGRLSSVMDLRTRSGDFERLGGRVYVTPFVSGGLLEGPLPVLRNSSWLFSARQGYIQQAAPRIYPYLRDSLPFQFQDIYGKLTFGRGPDQFNLWGFRQTDQTDLGTNGLNRWDQWGAGLNFSNLPANTRVRITGNLAYTRFSNTFTDARELRPRYSEIGGFNGGFTFSYLYGPDELAYSVEVRGFSTDFLFTNALGFITQQRQSNTEFAGWVKYQKTIREERTDETGELRFRTRAVIEPSLRLHFYNTYGYFSIEPRFRFKYNGRLWSLQAAAGRYVQNWVAAVSDRDIVILFQGFLTAPELPANKRFSHPLQEAYHLTAGGEYQLGDWLLSAEGWYKRFTQLTIINRERLFPEEPAFLTEIGYAYGVDATVRYQSLRWGLHATYSYQYNRRKDFRIEYFPLWDRRHTANLTANYRWGGRIATRRHSESTWELSIRWTLGSGLPFTQTLGFFEKLLLLQGSQSPYIVQQGQLAILLSPNYNAARLPAYHRLDLTAKRRWRMGAAFLLEANFTLLNAYNRPNLFYIDRISARRYNQLPILPSIGLTGLW